MATRTVTEKRLNIVVYGADRQLWAGGTLRVTVRDLFRGLDLHGEDVRGSIVEVRLDLPFDAGQLYGLRLTRPGHRPAWYALSRQSFIRDGRVERDEGKEQAGLALGYHGPRPKDANAVPVQVRHEQIPDDRESGHGDYLPAAMPTPEQDSAIHFTNQVLGREPRPVYPD